MNYPYPDTTLLNLPNPGKPKLIPSLTSPDSLILQLNPTRSVKPGLIPKLIQNHCD